MLMNLISKGGEKMTTDSFKKMMETFTRVYEKDLSADLLIIYYNVLKEIPDTEVDRIIDECLRRNSFFPKPADIIRAFEFVYDPLQTLE